MHQRRPTMRPLLLIALAACLTSCSSTSTDHGTLAFTATDTVSIDASVADRAIRNAIADAGFDVQIRGIHVCDQVVSTNDEPRYAGIAVDDPANATMSPFSS